MKSEIIESNTFFVFNGPARIFGNVYVKRRLKDGSKVGPMLALVKSDHQSLTNPLSHIQLPLTEKLIDTLRYAVRGSGIFGSTTIKLPRDRGGELTIHVNGETGITSVGFAADKFVLTRNPVEDREELLKSLEFLDKVRQEIDSSTFAIGLPIVTKQESFHHDKLKITLLNVARPFRFDRLSYLMVDPCVTREEPIGVKAVLVSGFSKFTFSLPNKSHANYQFCLDRYRHFLAGLKLALRGCHKSGVHYIMNTPPIQFVSWEPPISPRPEIESSFWLTLFDQTYNQHVQFLASEYTLAVMIEQLEETHRQWEIDNH